MLFNINAECRVSELSKAPGSIQCSAQANWFEYRWKYVFSFEFLLLSGSSQLGDSHKIEIKHDIHPE